MEFHRLLKRQIKNFLTEGHLNDPAIKDLLECVNRAYSSYDQEYKQLEHILELSNKESFKALKDLQVSLNQVASVITIDAHGEIQELNENFFKLTGYNVNDILYKSIQEVFFVSNEFKRQLPSIFKTLRNGDSWRGEFMLYKANGAKLFTNSSIIPVLNENKQLIKYLIISFDISEEKKAKENLIRSEEKYRNIISNMNLGLIEVNLDETILTVNQSFCDMSGFSKEELIGMNTKDLIASDSSKVTIDEKKKLREKKVSDLYELEFINKKGEYRYWLISGAPKYNEHGEIVGSIGIHFDITERKEQEQKMQNLLDTLQRVNKDLNDFAYIVSHDLKAPLRGIGSLATWLETDYADKLDNEGKETLQLLVQRTQRMHNLIDGILNYSKIGRTKEHIVFIDTQSLLHKIIDLLNVPTHIQIVFANTLHNVFFDQIKLQQVFQNILSNSIKFMDKEHGIITISSIESEGFIKFSIVDNGPGIKKDYHEKIFQIFQTVNSRDEFESTGIGLAIVKKIIESSGGHIDIHSTPNEGLEFSFFIKK